MIGERNIIYRADHDSIIDLIMMVTFFGCFKIERTG